MAPIQASRCRPADNSHIIIHPAAYPIIIHESNIHTQILQHTQGFLSLSFEFLTPPSPLSHGTHTCLLAKAPPTPATVLMHLWPKRVMWQKMKSLPPVLFRTTVLSFGRRPSRSSSGKIAPQERLQMPLRKGFRLQANTPPQERTERYCWEGRLRS